MTYADAWLSEMWTPVRELDPAERELQRLADEVARERYGRPDDQNQGR